MADLKVKVGLDRSGFTTGLASMENSVKGFGTKVGGILAGAFAFDSIISGFSKAIEKGDQLQDLANRFGIAASSLQKIGNAASLSGSGIEDVASAMNKLAKNAGEAVGGNGAMAEAFAKIGLSVADLKGMSPQDLFMALSKAVASGSLGMQAFSVAMQLAGKGAGSLMETLRMGPEAIAINGQAMGVFSDETIAKLSEASDAIKSFQNNMTIAFGTLAQIAMPLVTVFEDLVQFTTMLASAAGSAITGDFAGASEITKEAGKIKIRRDQEEARQKRLKSGTSRVFDQDGSGGLSAAEDKAFEKSEQAAARHELKLIDAKVLGTEEAEKQKAAIEERYAQRALDRAKELAQQRADLMPELEDLQAQRAGPSAERALLQRRATEAGEQARSSKNVEDVARAERAALAFQRAKESQLRSRGFGDASASMARTAANQAVGPLPSSAQLQQSLNSSTQTVITQTAKQVQNTKQLEKLNVVLDKMVQAYNKIPKNFPTAFENQVTDKESSLVPGNFVPGIAEMFDFKKLLDNMPDISAPKTQPVELENPPDLKPIMDKLDELIKNAGVFS